MLSEWMMMMINKWQAWHNLRSNLGIFLEAAAKGRGARRCGLSGRQGSRCGKMSGEIF